MKRGYTRSTCTSRTSMSGSSLRVLEIMRRSYGNVSGESIAHELNMSRAAVWKHVKTLEKMGYTFDAAQKAGYRLTGTPNVPTAVEIGVHLRTEWLGQHRQYLPMATSTNGVLAKKAAEKPEGFLLVAETQSMGRGLMARRWFSPPGVNLYMSVLLRPNVTTQQIPAMYQVAGLAVVSAIRKFHPKVHVVMRWPNDLLVDGQKLGVILCDMQTTADTVTSLFVGIAVNVNMRRSMLPPGLAGKATSLREQLGREVLRPQLAAAILNQLEPLYKRWLAHGLGPMIPELENVSCQQGKNVVVTTMDGMEYGKAVGIAPSGALILETVAGARKEILSGDVQLR